MYKNIFTLILLIISFQIHAQKNVSFLQAISKSYAFVQEIKPGMVVKEGDTDDAGNVIKQKTQYKYMAFIETKGASIPVWKTAWINGSPYTIETSLVESGIDVGTKSGDNKITVLNPRKGYRLWQLNFEPAGKKAKPYFNKAQRAANLVLQGTYKGSSVLYTIKKFTSIEPEETY